MQDEPKASTRSAPFDPSAQVLHFSNMTKRYGAATVLRDVALTLQPGRIHALMGENGAGKSTFIKVIAGLVPADQLTVTRGGAPVSLTSPHDAALAGFRFIHQELNVVPQLSVAENILLGHQTPTRFGVLVDWTALATRAQAALAELGVDHIDVRDQAGALGTGDRMLIKLAAALVTDDAMPPPSLYVLDEPTAALKEAEVQKLFTVLRRLRADGAAILYVSHRMEEITEICDDVSVLRNGNLIRSGPVADTSSAQIVQDMTGKDLGQALPARTAPIGDQIICQVRDVSTPTLSNLSFDLRAGEILGLAGLSGAGQTEVLRLFLGLEPIQSGASQLLGAPLPRTPSQAWARGVAYVPQERRSEGLMMKMPVRSNIVLPHLPGWWANLRNELRQTQDLADHVKLKADGPEQSVWQLSGGNQQKVVFARAMAKTPRLMLLDDPTRGVDIGARFEIYGLIRALSAKGCAILVASGDLPELIGLSDHVLTLQAGRQTGLQKGQDLTPGKLLTLLYHSDEGFSA